jgi:hypothetical protein
MPLELHSVLDAGNVDNVIDTLCRELDVPVYCLKPLFPLRCCYGVMSRTNEPPSKLTSMT